MATDDLHAQAERFMRDRRFAEAVAHFELHLATHPNDVSALLRQGICHLLAGSERAFLATRRRVQPLLDGLRVLSDDVRSLWETYERLFRKITATALVVGPLAACGGAATPPDLGDPAPVPADQPTIQTPAPDPGSMHRYSGGVYLEPRPDELAPAEDDSGDPEPADTPAAAEEMKPEEKPQPASMHRYSGGVYRPPIPPPILKK